MAPKYAPREQQGVLICSDIQMTRPSKKLSHKHLEPFTIERQIGNGAYHLRFPVSMSCLHPVFNVVKLSPATDDPIPGRHATPPPASEIVDEEEWMVEEILDSKVIKTPAPCEVEMLQIEHNTWEPWDYVHAPDLIAEFYWNNPEATRHIRSIEFQSIPFQSVTVLGSHFPKGGVGCKGTANSRPTSEDNPTVHHLSKMHRHPLWRSLKAANPCLQSLMLT